jgi:hypothetical protein
VSKLLLPNDSSSGDVGKFARINIVKAVQVILSVYIGNEIYWALVTTSNYNAVPSLQTNKKTKSMV